MAYRMAGLVFVIVGISAFFVAHHTKEVAGYFMGCLFAGVGAWLVRRKTST